MGFFAVSCFVYFHRVFLHTLGPCFLHKALLSAIGVGEKSATVLGATFQVVFEGSNWNAWRCLIHILSGVMHCTYIIGSNLDSNAKMWRLVADLMNDLGMLMDLLSPLFPSAFVFVVCFRSLSRSFSKSISPNVEDG
ncbi:hypothetical protein Patl1_13781 [Pistacia atlantica]|uniref:Uncharacterized protein n=1 Tax=Pistacia atlantica TaxID=434234 RepID=A0ACC1AX28_9ROSI|nr:hypothetical protein Patl1_13781 [Pistacia atlantica]